MATTEDLHRQGCDPAHFIWSRRSLLSYAGWVAVLGSLGAALAALVRMCYPRVLFEPPSEFRVGRPDEYRPGTVSDRWLQKLRFWVVREGDTLVALSGRCTHLGCTPRWLESENKFKCPCHGTGFRGLGGSGPGGWAGVNYEGPAPRPLERFAIRMGDDGQVVVDTSRVFRGELGQWGNPDASLRVG